MCVVTDVSGGMPTRLAGAGRATERTDSSRGVSSFGANN